MILKGALFWAKDIPSVDSPHFVVIISCESKNGEVLAVPISSIKFSENGKMKYEGRSCKYYDNACVITALDIPNFITKPSFARYQYATAISANKILKKHSNSMLKYKCHVSDALVRRIQDGARISKEMRERRYVEFFDFF